MSSNDDWRVPERPNISQDTWFGFALGGAIVTLIAYCFGAAAIYFDTSLDGRVTRALVPFGAALLAGVTFLTVVWRGIISENQLKLQSQQLAQQIEQLNQVIRQNDTKDAELKAKLLQDAAKLLSEQENAHQVRAGITALDVLVRDPQQTHSTTAMHIVAEYLTQTVYEGPPNALQRSAFNVLSAGDDRGLSVSDQATFIAAPDEGSQLPTLFWPIIKGIHYITFKGGSIRRDSFEYYKKKSVSFINVTFLGIDVYEDIRTHECKYNRCNIFEIDAYNISKGNFTVCDFSGAIFSNILDIKFTREDIGKQNYYIEGQPPNMGAGLDPRDYFRVVTEKEAYLRKVDV